MGRGSSLTFSEAPGPRLVARADATDSDLPQTTAAELQRLNNLSAAELEGFREAIGSLGELHGLGRRWAVLDYGSGSDASKGGRCLAYSLDTRRDAVLWPAAFADLSRQAAANKLQRELCNIAELVAARPRRTIEQRVLLDVIGSPLPA